MSTLKPLQIDIVSDVVCPWCYIGKRRIENALALAPRTVNLAEWCSHLLERLNRQCEATADPDLLKLYYELKAYPMPARSGPLSSDNVAIPFKLRLNGDVLSFISTTMIFGTPVDITLSELALETFFPADELTAERMRAMAAAL